MYNDQTRPIRTKDMIKKSDHQSQVIQLTQTSWRPTLNQRSSSASPHRDRGDTCCTPSATRRRTTPIRRIRAEPTAPFAAVSVSHKRTEAQRVPPRLRAGVMDSTEGPLRRVPAPLPPHRQRQQQQTVDVRHPHRGQAEAQDGLQRRTTPSEQLTASLISDSRSV